MSRAVQANARKVRKRIEGTSSVRIRAVWRNQVSQPTNVKVVRNILNMEKQGANRVLVAWLYVEINV